MENTIRIHLMDNPIFLTDSDILKDIFIIGTGSKYGRFIFNQDRIAVSVKDATNVQIDNCQFENFDIAFKIDTFLDPQIKINR